MTFLVAARTIYWGAIEPNFAIFSSFYDFFFASSDLLATFREFWSIVSGSEIGRGKETLQFQ